MGRRYYCDYCDKTFIDELEARKKHLQSSYHIKLRNLHYENQRDAHQVLNEEVEKQPCRRFFNNGACKFSGMCKYTHYTPEELWDIRQQIEVYEKNKLVKVPTVDSWLKKYYENHQKETTDILQIPWTYPENLEQRLDLPPSIRKARPEQFIVEEFEEWGK